MPWGVEVQGQVSSGPSKEDMMISGVVDFLVKDTLSGWVKGPVGGGVQVHINVAGNSFQVPADIVRNPDKPSSVQFGYRFQLPGEFNASHLFDGTITVSAAYGDMIVALEVWKPLHIAAGLDAMDPGDIRRAIRFIKTERHLLLQDVIKPSWSRPKISERRPLCILTYAHDNGGWFPYFYRYYSNIAGPDSIFLVTPNAAHFSSYSLGGVINLQGAPYDNNPRAELMSNLCSGLQAYFKWTLLCDVDEIVLPHPARGLSFIDALEQCKGLVSISRGLEIIQSDDEEDFDFSSSVLEQRRFGIANSAYCKPHLAQASISYANGYHYSNHRPAFEAPGEGFLTFHLKWACKSVRDDVLKILKKTSYADEATALRSRAVTSASIHPSLLDGTPPVIPFSQENFQGFEQRYLSELRYMPGRGHWGIGYFCSDAIYDLSLLRGTVIPQ